MSRGRARHDQTRWTQIQKSPILFGHFSLNADRVFRGKITFLVAITVHIEGSPEEGRK
jgi:hypothetical protein